MVETFIAQFQEFIQTCKTQIELDVIERRINRLSSVIPLELQKAIEIRRAELIENKVEPLNDRIDYGDK